MKQILLVEDDLSFGAVLKSYLELNEYHVTWVDNGANAIPAFNEGNFDICVLDVMLPKVDGFTIANKIKSINADMPLIFLTAKALKEDILTGYKLGADDYITKPFDSDVLIAKIQAILSRTGSTVAPEPEPQMVQIGKFQFDTHLRTLSDGENTQKLSPKEGDLLKLLVSKKNNLLNRSEALLKIWGDDSYFTTRSMDVYVTKIRKYLKSDPNISIENIHSAGYRLLVAEE